MAANDLVQQSPLLQTAELERLAVELRNLGQRYKKRTLKCLTHEERF